MPAKKIPCPACKRPIGVSSHHCMFCGVPLEGAPQGGGGYSAPPPRRRGYVKSKGGLGNIVWTLVILALLGAGFFFGMEACNKADFSKQGEEWFEDKRTKE